MSVEVTRGASKRVSFIGLLSDEDRCVDAPRGVPVHPRDSGLSAEGLEE